jgi:ABC-type transporter Mla subunit MlaD
MSPEFRDTLEQSQRLLQQRERAQAVYEARLQASKRAFARADRLLARLKELFSRAGASLREQH